MTHICGLTRRRSRPTCLGTATCLPFRSVRPRCGLIVALATTASAATPITPAVSAFAALGPLCCAGLSLRNGGDGGVDMTGRLRRLGFAGWPRRPLAFTRGVPGPIAVAARLLRSALGRALFLRVALLARLTALPVAAPAVPVVAASLTLVAALGTFLGAATAFVARRVPALRCRGGHDFRLARASLEPGHHGGQPVFTARRFVDRCAFHRHRRGQPRRDALDGGFLPRLSRFFLLLLEDIFLFRALHHVERRRQWLALVQVVVTQTLHLVVRRLEIRIGNQEHVHLESRLDAVNLRPFLVEQERADIDRHLRDDLRGVLLHGFFLQDAQDVQ